MSLYDDLYEILVEQVDTREWIRGALHGCEVQKRINWQVSTAEDFTHHVIRVLLNYGVCSDKPAMVLVLEELKQRVGDDRQEKIDKLIVDVMAYKPGREVIVSPIWIPQYVPVLLLITLIIVATALYSFLQILTPPVTPVITATATLHATVTAEVTPEATPEIVLPLVMLWNQCTGQSANVLEREMNKRQDDGDIQVEHVMTEPAARPGLLITFQCDDAELLTFAIATTPEPITLIAQTELSLTVISESHIRNATNAMIDYFIGEFTSAASLINLIRITNSDEQGMWQFFYANNLLLSQRYQAAVGIYEPLTSGDSGQFVAAAHNNMGVALANDNWEPRAMDTVAIETALEHFQQAQALAPDANTAAIATINWALYGKSIAAHPEATGELSSEDLLAACSRASAAIDTQIQGYARICSAWMNYKELEAIFIPTEQCSGVARDYWNSISEDLFRANELLHPNTAALRYYIEGQTIFREAYCIEARETQQSRQCEALAALETFVNLSDNLPFVLAAEADLVENTRNTIQSFVNNACTDS